MQFNTNVVSEIVIPSNAPFAPGNDVIGIGFAVPPELQAEGIISAMIFYNSLYSSSSTLPRVKYAFFGQGSQPDPDYQVFLSQGFVWQAKPSANTALIVVNTSFTGMAAPSSSGYTVLNAASGGENHNGNDIFVFGESNVTGDGTAFALTNAGASPSGTSTTKLVG